MGDGQTVQRPHVGRSGLVRPAGLVERLLGNQGDDCVDLRVDPLDLSEMRLKRLLARHLSATESAG